MPLKSPSGGLCATICLNNRQASAAIDLGKILLAARVLLHLDHIRALELRQAKSSECVVLLLLAACWLSDPDPWLLVDGYDHAFYWLRVRETLVELRA